MLEPKIVEKEAIKIVGLEAPFIHILSPDANNTEVLPKLWKDFLGRLDEIKNRDGHDMYGYIYGFEEEKRSHPDELHYCCGVPVNAYDTIPEKMKVIEIPGSQYAVFRLVGKIENIKDHINKIYQEWLPQSEYKHSGLADVEFYDKRFNPESDDSIYEYWISTSKK